MDIYNNFSNCSPKPPNVVINDTSNISIGTWISTLLSAFIVTFGSIQFIEYYKYGSPIEAPTKKPQSKQSYSQLCFLTLIASLSAMIFPDPNGRTVKML